MIGEQKQYLDNGCGCALGTAYVGAGFPYSENPHFEWPDSNFQNFYAEKLGITPDLATEISTMHYSGQRKRLEIAKWLDTLEPETKPADKQSFDAFMSTVMKPVEVTA